MLCRAEMLLCLFGKNAVDTDRSVVPAATAGWLGWPQALFVKAIESVDGGSASVVRMTETGIDRVSMPLPAVISVVKEINEPRLPSLKGKIKAKSAPIETWNAGDLGVGANHLQAAAVGQAEVDQHDVGRVGGELTAGLREGARRLGSIDRRVAHQGGYEVAPGLLIVFYYEYARFGIVLHDSHPTLTE